VAKLLMAKEIKSSGPGTAKSFKKTSFRFSSSLFKEFKNACTNRDMQQSDGIEEAVRMWLRKPPGTASLDPSQESVNTDHPWTSEWSVLVLEFLRGTLKSAEALLERGREAIPSEAGHDGGSDDVVKDAIEAIRIAENKLRPAGGSGPDRSGDESGEQSA
jgi:hypothetical protein